jgi:diacylglycerol kinase (ATP)
MRALAILGPNTAERDVVPFRLSGVEMAISDHVAQADAVLVFGGDGTVHRHLAELQQTQTPLLVTPAGSGTDFARALGLGTSSLALAAWKRFVAGGGNVRAIDLGVIAAAAAEPRSFCCVAGAGLDADANRRANALPRWLRSHGGYLLAAAFSLLAYRRFHARLRAESAQGEVLLDFAEAAALVAMANAPSYGGGLRIAPAARLDDGKLELVFLRARNRFLLAWKARKLRTGEHIGLPEVEYARFARLALDCDPARDVYADGELVGRTPITVWVAPRALRVIA